MRHFSITALLVASCLSLFSQDYYVNLKARVLHYDFFEVEDVQLETPFEPEQALRSLFPGNFSKELSLVKWSCTKCPSLIDEGAWLRFPAQNNITYLLDTLSFSGKNGNKNMLVSFNSIEADSTDYVGDLTTAGLLTDCGILGFALFEKRHTKWNLVFFEPSIGCLGNWGQAPKPKTVLDLGDNTYGILIERCSEGQSTSSCGNVQKCYYSMYMIQENAFSQKPILENWLSQRIEEGKRDGINFDSQIDLLSTGGEFTDFTIRRAVHFDKSEIPADCLDVDYIMEFLPKEVQNEAFLKNKVEYTEAHKIRFNSHKNIYESVSKRIEKKVVLD